MSDSDMATSSDYECVLSDSPHRYIFDKYSWPNNNTHRRATIRSRSHTGAIYECFLLCDRSNWIPPKEARSRDTSTQSCSEGNWQVSCRVQLPLHWYGLSDHSIIYGTHPSLNSDNGRSKDITTNSKLSQVLRSAFTAILLLMWLLH